MKLEDTRGAEHLMYSIIVSSNISHCMYACDENESETS